MGPSTDLPVGRITFSLSGHRYEMSGPDLRVAFPDGAIVFTAAEQWKEKQAELRAEGAAAQRAADAELVRAAGCMCPMAREEDYENWAGEWISVPGESEPHLKACPIALAAAIEGR